MKMMSNTKEQYVVTAVYKENGVVTQHIVLVTDDEAEAHDYDISAYRELDDPRWNVWVECFTLDDNNIVLEQCGTQCLYPSIATP